jgi:hypothetical protein
MTFPILISVWRAFSRLRTTSHCFYSLETVRHNNTQVSQLLHRCDETEGLVKSKY